jgi:hypothetical protein
MSAGYTPIVDAMAPDDAEFLARLAPSGIDWRATRIELVQRLGARRYRSTWDAVALPEMTALSDDPLVFWAQCFPETMDLPPEYWFAEYFPHDDARANHAAIERQLTARLGKPVHRDTSNCLVRVWRAGVFRVEVHTFPPEAQPLETTNVLHAQEPRLAIASSVSIESDYAFVFPDASLAPIAARIGTPAVLDVEPKHLRVDSQFLPRRETRRNPEALVRAMPASRAIAWQDPDRVGLSTKAVSLVVERPAGASVLLDRQIAGRGPAGSTLSVRRRLGEADVATSLLHGDDEGSLDAIAERLASFWGMALQSRTVSSD